MQICLVHVQKENEKYLSQQVSHDLVGMVNKIQKNHKRFKGMYSHGPVPMLGHIEYLKSSVAHKFRYSCKLLELQFKYHSGNACKLQVSA